MIAGKYVLDRLLGQGGMGAVFAAKHVKLSKAVAIKIMLADASNPEAAQRFINEGRAAANIQNEHVVRVDDVDEERGYAYMVLELLDGEDLAQVLERESVHRLAPHVAVGYVLEALKGVAQAHAIGIVHRDLKPSNLFLAKRPDGSVVVKVLDFGISKAQGSSALAASPNALTSTKAMLGSPLYMSPEQLRSSKSVDHRADIWAMGVILYELITGSLPFMGENLGELFAAILETDPTPLRQRAEGVHPGLDEVVLRCLARRPEQRFQSALELSAALAPFANAQPGFVARVGASAPVVPPNPNPMASGQHPAVSHHGPRPGMPMGAITPPGAAMPGAVAPQGMVQTNGGWQSTGGGAAGLPTSKTPVIIGALAAAVFFVVAVGGVALIVKSRKATPDPSALGSSNVASSTLVGSTPPPAVSSVAPVASTAEPAASTPVPASASASAVAAAATTPPPPAPKPTHHSSPVVKVDPPPKPTAEPAPKPRPTPTSNANGGLQNAR
jgi:serine/threonine-protein kinase